MMAVWVVVGLAVAGVVIVLMASWRRDGQPANYGVVSDQWIAEHRFGSEQNSRR
jgi:hypothetical protein